jgi:hypothetical protein
MGRPVNRDDVLYDSSHLGRQPHLVFQDEEPQLTPRKIQRLLDALMMAMNTVRGLPEEPPSSF